jgi:hypothetical protein
MCATRWRAQHGQVRRDLDLGQPLAHPRRNWSSGDSGKLVLEDGVHGFTAGYADLDGAEVLEMRHRRLGGCNPASAAARPAAAVRDSVAADQQRPAGAGPCWPSAHPIKNTSAPRQACRRLCAA